MKKINKIFDSILESEVGWFSTFLLWSISGIVFIYYVMKSKGLINVESTKTTVTAIGTLITAGILYGLVSNLIVGFLIKLTGQLFKGNNDLRNIYKTLAKSYWPYVIFVVTILLGIYLSRVILISSDSIVRIVLSITVFLIIVGQAILSISQVILLIRGLRNVQGISTIKTILNYLISTLIFGVFYYYIIEPNL
ncbi:YIP1 family protein [Carboxylicivirga mesophila]|uniref:YIP1 family protein n=1 Tax=Carboxylicivirga mesophila TaxID=1166478 RepID=A0ABS5KI86_9BACT|nr:YIP1 family protein [Carboxylicivirga mesophila]MBS2214036.1 YIP1 family protein [Carboxylicivirga mesophila]